MDSLKFILGVLAMVLCMGAAGAVIWVLLFGVPKGAMDGGTLVQVETQIQRTVQEWTEEEQAWQEWICQEWIGQTEKFVMTTEGGQV